MVSEQEKAEYLQRQIKRISMDKYHFEVEQKIATALGDLDQVANLEAEIVKQQSILDVLNEELANLYL